MHRIDSRTVELTRIETSVSERFEAHLFEEGRSIRNAAQRALEWAIDSGCLVSAEFADYLSEGTVMVTEGGRVQPTWPF